MSFSVCVQGRAETSVSRASVFTSKASKDVAKSLEINTLEGKCITAVFNGFPSFTTSHESPKLSISISTQSSRGDEKLCPDAVRCLP